MTTREFQDRLGRRARREHVSVPTLLSEQLESYFRLLALWNQRINLTALTLTEPTDESFDRLLVEPLVAAKYVQPFAAVLDVGSGSGSPAIPLALACPGLRLRLVESKVRKSVFLTEAIRHLGLQGASVENVRFETLLTRPDLHEALDIVSIRAVRVEPRTLLSLQAFLRPGGRVFWFRGPTGPEAPDVPMPLQWLSTHRLVEALRSRLTILEKQSLG